MPNFTNKEIESMGSGKNTTSKAIKIPMAYGGRETLTNSPDSILIFAADEATVSPRAHRVLKDMVPGLVGRASNVAVSTLEENMRRFLSSLGAILATSPKNIGGLTLDEVEIHAQIDGKGNIGIAGIAGAELAVQGGITFVLRKKS